MLLSAGYRVGVLYPDWSGSFLAGLKSRGRETFVNDNGLPTWCLRIHNLVPRWNKLNLEYIGKKTEKIFERYCTDYGKPDILHAHSVFAGGVVAKHLSRSFHIPFVITEHSSELIMNPCKGFLYEQVCKVITSAKKWLCVSGFLSEQLKKVYNLQNCSSHILHNSIHPLFFKLADPPPPKPFTWIVIGSLTKVKNHTLLLKAFTLLLKEFPKSILQITGDGPLKKKLILLTRELEIGSNLRFLGSKSRDEVKELLNRSHALVSASTLETFGISIAEALASGRPVVVTGSGGPAEIVTENDGIIVKTHSTQPLAEAMLNMIKNYNTYDADKISKNCEERFSEKIICGKLGALYNEISDN